MSDHPSSVRRSYDVFVRSYDVFVCHRGIDSRKCFIAPLCKALRVQGIKIFVDDDKLEWGDDLFPTLAAAIENSKFAIIVLSRNYASSWWCLEELVKILDCMKTMGLGVLPIFYNVQPSHVRYQKGNIGKALATYLEKRRNTARVPIWKEALTEVANMFGYHSRKKFGRHRPKLIERITNHVWNKLICRSSKYAEPSNVDNVHFKLLAFQKASPADDYAYTSNRAVVCAQGLQLAFEVLGLFSSNNNLEQESSCDYLCDRVKSEFEEGVKVALKQDIASYLAFSTVIPDKRIPNWISYQNSSDEVNAELPANWSNRKILGFVLCAIPKLGFGSVIPFFGPLSCRLFYSTFDHIPSSFDVCTYPKNLKGRVGSGRMWMIYVPLPLFSGFGQTTQIRASFRKTTFMGSSVIKECGIGLVYANEYIDYSIFIPPDRSCVTLQEIHVEGPSGSRCSNIDGSESDVDYYSADEGEPATSLL